MDLPEGKNLCGAFSQPIGVLCDTEVLKTLSPAIFADGMAEVIKYGYIGDGELLAALAEDTLDLEYIISRCVADKRDVVEEDETDNGRRQLLNLGHTAGHAVEKLSDFQISHGSAVAIGMLLIARAAAASGLADTALPTHVKAMLKRYDLPTDCPYGAKALAEVALSDKKRRGGVITLALPTAIGKSELYPMPTDALVTFFLKGGAAL